jgi:ornithine decarboxylase
MIPRDVKAPTTPIPFHKLLKVVAIVDRNDPQTKELLDHIVAENFQVELCDSLERDVSEDASVGAYIAWIDGERLEQGRKLARSVRENGLRTPLWALADSHRISDLAVLSLTGEVDGYIYLGQQTPAFYAKQVVASLVKYGRTLLPPPGIGVIVPGERWDNKAKPMLDYFLAFQESFNRFPGFNYEVQGVFQERVNGRIKFHTYVVRE